METTAADTVDTSAPVRRNKRGDILREAARLFAARGIAATSIRDIADAVGVKSASLYHHFASKEQIVQEILAEPARHLLAGYEAAEAASAHPLEQLRGLLRASFDTLQVAPDACAIFQNDYGYLAAFAGYAPLLQTFGAFQEVWLRVLGRGAAEGLFRRDVPPVLFYRLCRDAVWALVGPYRRGEIGQADLDAAVEVYADLLLNGYATSHPRN